ncbi:hypothetical protein Zm00014a_026366 [Zea mays]|uniref:Uncharacterized protein n=1 Tax=Zea mays TaxID=4577 RepID=A0A3L6G5Y3_MAIZE|nr:hypothetical protein Zm00014a_026366 [Zea mays]
MAPARSNQSVDRPTSHRTPPSSSSMISQSTLAQSQGTER